MDTLRNQAIAAVYEAIGRQAQAVEPGDDGAPIYIPAIVDAVIDAVLPSAIEWARREALEEAAGVLEEEAADWIADATAAEADGHPRIAADFRRWAKEASKRARRIRALASKPPAPPSDGCDCLNGYVRGGSPSCGEDGVRCPKCHGGRALPHPTEGDHAMSEKPKLLTAAEEAEFRAWVAKHFTATDIRTRLLATLDAARARTAELEAERERMEKAARHLIEITDAQRRHITLAPKRESEDDSNSRDERDQVFGDALQALRALLTKEASDG